MPFFNFLFWWSDYLAGLVREFFPLQRVSCYTICSGNFPIDPDVHLSSETLENCYVPLEYIYALSIVLTLPCIWLSQCSLTYFSPNCNGICNSLIPVGQVTLKSPRCHGHGKHQLFIVRPKIVVPRSDCDRLNIDICSRRILCYNCKMKTVMFHVLALNLFRHFLWKNRRENFRVREVKKERRWCNAEISYVVKNYVINPKVEREEVCSLS